MPPHSTVPLPDDAQVVRDYIRPATAQGRICFVDCLRNGSLACKLDWCPHGTTMRLADDAGVQPAFGPATYFARHARTCAMLPPHAHTHARARTHATHTHTHVYPAP